MGAFVTKEWVGNIASYKCYSLLIEGPKCKNLIDIGFIVDSSGSLRREYGKEKAFVKSLAESFEISANGSRAGIITFSWHAEHSVKLKDHATTESFKVAVDKLPLFGHTTRIDKALKMARDELFKSENGGRTSIPKLVIVLTDGAQTKDADAVDPGDIADEIRRRGVKVIVIGIGRRVNSTELLHMAGGEKKNVYLAKNFDELKSGSFVESVSKSSCNQGKWRLISREMYDL